MERHPTTLPARSLGALLDETFAIYGRHLKRLIWIAALVQGPTILFSTVVLEIWGVNATTLAITTPISALASVIVYAAAIFAVGQQYLAGEIDVRRCYRRAFWRARSLALMTLIIIGPILMLLSILMFKGDSLLAALAVLMVFPLIVVGVYWSVAVQAVVVEGYRAVGALRRSYGLIAGSWWRVFGISAVLLLVVTGLSIMITVPFAVISAVLEPAQTLVISARFLADLAVSIAVPLVLFIFGTLLYYDLRVRKEEFDLETMSRELGIASV